MRLFALFLFLTNLISILFLVWTILLTVVFEWDLHECEQGFVVYYKQESTHFPETKLEKRTHLVIMQHICVLLIEDLVRREKVVFKEIPERDREGRSSR